MPRNSNDVLFGGGYAFVNGQDIGWLAQGEIQLEEQKSETVIKESMGASVVTIASSNEAHFTCAMLETNPDLLLLLNPAYTRKVYAEEVKTVANELVSDLGKLSCLKFGPVVDLSTLKVEPATTLVSPVAVDDTVLYVASTRQFAANDTILLTRGQRSVTATINSIDATEGALTISTALTEGFASGSVVKNTTAAKAYALGTDFYILPDLGLVQRAATSVNAKAGDGASVSYSYQSAQGRGYAMGAGSTDEPFKFEFWHKKRDGKYLCVRALKAKLSGNFAPFGMTQDNEKPINLDLIFLIDDDGQSYEIIEYADGSIAPNGGW